MFLIDQASWMRGTPYGVVVTATNDLGESDPSTVVDYTTPL